MDTKEKTTRTQSWFGRRAPEMAGEWRRFHDSVYETGELDLKTKELVAVAAGAVMRCTTCTKGHIRKAERAGATKEEIAEALMVASLMGSGTQLFWMKEDYEALLGDDGGDDGSGASWFEARTGEMGTAWRAYHDRIYASSALDRKAKELVAAVCGSLLRCRHCTRVHIQKAKRHAASEEEIAEAFMVGALIASGSQLAWMKEDYEELLG